MRHDRLDPVRLRPRSLIRYAAVAALLVLAAGVLLLDAPARRTGPTDCGTPSPSAVGATASPRGAAEPLPVPSGRVGVPVQLAEPAAVSVLRPGDRVDVIARTGVPRPASAGPEGAESASPKPRPGDMESVLARNALVLSVRRDGSLDAGVVYLALTPQEAQRVARVPPDVAIGVTVRPR